MIYEKIKKCCALKGISVSQLECDLNMARGSLCKIDKHKPSLEKMTNIADYLETTVEYLMTGEDKQEFVMPKYNNLVGQVAEDFCRLTNSQQVIVANLIKEFLTANNKPRELEKKYDQLCEELEYLENQIADYHDFKEYEEYNEREIRAELEAGWRYEIEQMNKNNKK